jgi:hypothetical protein
MESVALWFWAETRESVNAGVGPLEKSNLLDEFLCSIQNICYHEFNYDKPLCRVTSREDERRQGL